MNKKLALNSGLNSTEVISLTEDQAAAVNHLAEQLRLSPGELIHACALAHLELLYGGGEEDANPSVLAAVRGFVDERRSLAVDPADFPNHAVCGKAREVEPSRVAA